MYEAKALKSQVTKEKQLRYFIHYAGWNKNWDEWVPENRVLKFNDANVTKQKEIAKQHEKSAKSAKKANKSKKDSTTSSKDSSDSRASTPSKEVVATKESSTPTSTTSTSAKELTASTSRGAKTSKPSTPIPTETSSGSAAKKPRFDTVETEETHMSKLEVKIKIPEELKPWIVDDWDAVTRQHKLADLPAKKTVQEIIEDYISYKKSSKAITNSKETVVLDVALGIQDYFNVLLGSQLLYKFERPQYGEILKKHPDTKMASIYGAFHLLRLFVKLGSLLAFTALDEKSMQKLLGHIQDFMKFLAKNNSIYFNMNQFVNAPPEYHRM